MTMRIVRAAIVVGAVSTCFFTNTNAQDLEVLAEAETAPAAQAGAEESTEAPAPAANRLALDEVIVTAQKRAEDIQDVPLSVTAIGGEDIKEKNMADLNDVASFAPNLSILATPTFNFIYMRGIGSGLNKGFEQSVGILIDEVFYSRPSYLSNGLLDLAAVEVLRGPQGTLFGKNSAAGAIHLRTYNPDGEWGMDTDLLVGERNKYRIRMAVGGPLWSDELSWRVAMMSEEQDGDVENTTLNGRMERNLDNMNARAKLLWEPSSQFSTLLTFNTSTVNQGGGGTELTRVRARHLAAMQVYDPQTSEDVYDGKTHQDHPGAVDRDSYDGTVKMDYEFNSRLLLTSLTNYAYMDEDTHFDADFSPIPFLVDNIEEDFRQLSQELRFTSGPGEIEYVGGLFYLFNDIKNEDTISSYMELAEMIAVTGEGERLLCTNIPEPLATLLGPLGVADLRIACQDSEIDNAIAGQLAGQVTKARQDLEGQPIIEQSISTFEQETTSYAIFGQATWNITDIWSTTVGARASYERKELSYDKILRNNRTGIDGNGSPVDLQGNPNLNIVPGGSIAFPVIQSGSEDFTASRERTEFNISPKVSSQVNWTDDLMTYVTLAQGYKSGGFNASALNESQLEYEEEVSNTFELGFKSEWLDGAARLNVSGFWTQFSDLQISAFNGVAFVVTNAADAEIKGLEWEAMLVPFWGMFLTANGAYTDGKYQNFTGGPCSAEHQGETPCDLSGAPLTNAPKWQSTVGATYDNQLFNLPFRLHAGLTGIYSTSIILATDQDPVDVRGGGWLLNGRVGVRGLEENWHLMLFIDNILDREALAGNNDVPTFVGSHFGGRIPTTSFELEARIQF